VRPASAIAWYSCVQRRREGEQRLLALVVLVRPLRQHAGRRHDGQEAAGDRHVGQRDLQVGDVSADRRVARVPDRARDRPAAGLTDRLAQSRRAVGALVLGVELGKVPVVLAADGRDHGRGGGPVLDAAQPLEHVARPAHRLAELAVAHDVDPGVGLLADHRRHRAAERGRERRLVEPPAFLPGLDQRDQLGRSDQCVRDTPSAGHRDSQ
jgi:hypothetical protein